MLCLTIIFWLNPSLLQGLTIRIDIPHRSSFYWSKWQKIKICLTYDIEHNFSFIESTLVHGDDVILVLFQKLGNQCLNFCWPNTSGLLLKCFYDHRSFHLSVKLQSKSINLLRSLFTFYLIFPHQFNLAIWQHGNHSFLFSRLNNSDIYYAFSLHLLINLNIVCYCKALLATI